MQPQRVLVTGGSGFIGSHVVRLLKATGRDVALLSTVGRPSKRDARPATDVGILSVEDGDRSALERIIRDWAPDACIQLAWHAEPGKYLNAPENLKSLSDSLAVLQAVIACGCSRIAMAGTCAEYATSGECLREDSPTRPETLYAATKLSACLIAEQLAAQHDVALSWGRIFLPYGPGEDARRAVPSVIRALLEKRSFAATSGDQVRDFIHVEDVASAFLALIDAPGRGVFNVCSGEPVTMRRVMETIGDIVGAQHLIQFGALPYRAWDPIFICGENARLRETGWAPRYSLQAGLKHTVDWWRSQV